jgi:4-hydroxybenzoate polyprenyltransferase
MKAWLELMRAALGLTVAWDFLVGITLAGVVWQPRLWWALAALLSIYFAGMILNDCRDRAIDAAAERHRPLVDGRIRPLTALGVGLLLLGTGYLCALRSGPHLAQFSLYLMAIVVLYDLLGPGLRRHLGPALLGAARSFSLCFGAMAALGPETLLADMGVAAPLTYALYFLFVSRLAQREESGVAGLNGLAFLAMASVTPALLAQFERPAWPFYPVWLLIAAVLVLPAWPRRHESWSPAQVQHMVRRGLGLAPLIPGLMLLSSDADNALLLSPVAIGVCQVVNRLMRGYVT